MSLAVRVIAPTGRDADLITAVLLQHGVRALSCDAAEVISKSEHDLVGPLLIAEEALTPLLIQGLGRLLQEQPAWSDLPILILTASGRENKQSFRLDAERVALGSPILLERPIRTASLVSSVQAALRARARQYEIRDAVAELKGERETLHVLMENLPVGVVMVTPTGKSVLSNQRLDTILRHPLIATENIGSFERWHAYHADGTRLRAEEYPVARALQGSHPAPADYQYERGDQTRGWISLAASPLVDETGKVTGAVLAVFDIDHQKRAEGALIQSEKLAAVGRLAASISHEINNPLEAVTNLLYLARTELKLPQVVQEYLDAADEELQRVSQIVSQTLRFHRQSTKPRAITAAELLEPTLGLYGGRLTNSSVRLELRYRSRGLMTCYEGEIRQVLNNLVGNAIESMRAGGVLKVRTSEGCRGDGMRGVRITVSDTGHGMSEETMRRVFEAFYTTKGIHGTGLGLWIARGIVDKHRGLLQVRSCVGEGRSGSVFSLFLPLNPFAQVGAAPGMLMGETLEVGLPIEHSEVGS